MEQYIVFTVNDQDFAVDIATIERIIESQRPKKTPETSDYFLGVTQYSGEILPIIDLSKRLYKEATEFSTGTRIIVTVWKDKFIGLLVDDVLGVQNFDDGQFEASNRDMNLSKKYMTGFIKEKDNIIIVLDISKIFDTEQEKELMLALEG